MEVLPQRHPLATQVAGILRAEIARGEWREWLPGERALAETLHVSRNTLRAAIAQLGKEGVIEACHPIGTRIVQRPSRLPKPAATRTIGLLSPAPIDLFRPNVALIVDQLRAQLAEIGFRLRAHHGDRYFSTGAVRALPRLVREHAHDCWLLVLASEETKRWFFESGIPCVVSGSCMPGIDLPSVDLDYRALCRHAVGQITAAGHRRLAFLCEKSDRAGIFECQQGFREGLDQAAAHGITGRIMTHPGTPAGLLQALDRLRNESDPPTALLMSNPNHFLFAQTRLLRLGLKVPEDVSLVCADDDPFLSFVHPAPTRYTFAPRDFAGRLFKRLMLVVEHEVIGKKSVRLMPDYVKGATLAPLRA
jgi:LacI family transcriptional regulator